MDNIYKRTNVQSMALLTKKIRRAPLDKERVYMILDPDIILKTTKPRALINAHIFNLLEHYEIPKEKWKDFIFSGTFNKGDHKRFMERIFDTLYKTQFPHKNILISHVVADIISVFQILAITVDGVVSCDHSILDYANCYDKDIQFKKIFTENVFDLDDDPWTIQRKADAIIRKFQTGEIQVNPLSSFLKYGVKANASQMLMFFCYAMAPNYIDVREVLPPLGVGTLNGIRRAYHLFTFDMIGRLALFTTKNDVKVTGLQSKRMATCSSETKLHIANDRTMIDDCGSHLYFKIENVTEGDLNFFKFKNIYNPETHLKVGVVYPDRKDLLGKTIYIRTFAGCFGKVVCKECFGENWSMVSDTPLYKCNFHLYTLQEFNKKLQKVISIKHHSVAVLKPIPIEFNGIKYDNITDFIIEEDYIDKMAFDILVINPKYNIEFEPSRVEKDTKTKNKKRRVDKRIKERLLIDGKELITTQKLRRVGPNKFKITIPNDSPLLQAQDLEMIINKHSSESRGDFDKHTMKSLELQEQINFLYKYIRKKITLPHFVYYESIMHSLTRDADDPSRRINADSRGILFVHADHVLLEPKNTVSPSVTLPHGFIERALGTIGLKHTPTESDILYAGLRPRTVSSRNIIKDFNRSMMLNSPNIMGRGYTH